MDTFRVTRSGAPRLNTLAACLALALSASVGAGTDPTANQAPRSNRLADSVPFAQQDTGLRNRPNAGQQRATATPTRAPASVSVTSCADDGTPGTLRAVIASAQDGDTVDMTGLELICSRITLTAGRIDIRSNDLTLKGPEQDKLTIDGNNARMINGLRANLTIDALTITNGRFAYGGCVYASHNLTLTSSTITGCHASGSGQQVAYAGGVDVIGSLTMISSTITGNEVSDANGALGGGAYVYGTATLIDSTISNNIATAPGNSAIASENFVRGGGIIALGGVSLTRSAIIDNMATSINGNLYGGGVQVRGGAGTETVAIIDNSVISGNIAHSDKSWSYGGGISIGRSTNIHTVAKSGSIEITGSTISGNTASSNCANCVIVGGGVSAFGNITASNSSINDNRATSAAGSSVTAYGGGLATRLNTIDPTDGTITVSESTISGNTAAGRPGSQGGYGRGGGVAALLSPFVIANSTVAFNQASTSGGGVFEGANVSATSSLVSTIVANNQAPQAADIGIASPFSNGPGITLAGDHSLVLSASANIVLPVGTLNVDPMLLPLRWNGGPTQTHALAASSPAINAGNSNGDSADQRGTPFLRVFDGAADIGAFEVQPPPPTPPLTAIFRAGFETN